jgi:FkbM family methyltransferase
MTRVDEIAGSPSLRLAPQTREALRKAFPATRALMRRLFRKTGYDIHRRMPGEWDTLRRYQFQSILDIGANEGQFATGIRSMYPHAAIHSFEPLRGPYERLTRAFTKDPLAQAHCIALGETCGMVEMYENGESSFSSLLPMNSSGRRDFPVAGIETPRPVQMLTLDQWASSQILPDPILIKLDVQGYEDRIIRGGVETMRRASAVLTEVTFKPIYERQVLFDDLYTLLRSLGFKLSAMVNNMYDTSKTIVVQADAVFEKS